MREKSVKNISFESEIRKSGEVYLATIPKVLVKYFMEQYGLQLKKKYKFNIEVK